jgi:acyl-coenzyme A thioesterase PaaI-like protein
MTLPVDPRSAYTTDDPTETEPRARKHALVREVKRIVEHTAMLDIEEVPPEELDALVAQAGALADRLAEHPTLARFGGLATSPWADAALLERSGITGRSNPLAPPLHLVMGEDGVTRGHATYTAAYEGPAGCLHGGFVAAAFDDIMGVAQLGSGRAGYTGTLTVKMLKPTPLYKRIDYEASFDRIDGRKIYVSARSWDGDEQLAEAEIVFISPRDGSRPR